MIARALLALALSLSTAAIAAPGDEYDANGNKVVWTAVAYLHDNIPVARAPDAKVMLDLMRDTDPACSAKFGPGARIGLLTVYAERLGTRNYRGCWTSADGGQVGFIGRSAEDPQPMMLSIPTEKFARTKFFTTWTP